MSRSFIFNSKIDRVISNIVLVALSLFFGLWLIKFIFVPSPLVNILGYCILIMGVTVPILILKSKPEFKVKFAMSFLGFIVGLYVFEYFLEIADQRENQLLQKENKHTVEIMEQLDNKTKDVSMPVGTLSLLSVLKGDVSGAIKTSRGEIVPLSNAALQPTLLCENAGGPMVFRSDRFGFHNPDEVWDSNLISVAILGDSYVEGVCVKTEKNILSEIKKEYPNSLNLGLIGNGPLIMLGAIQEYLRFKQPEVVIWAYYNNDIYPNLSMEKDNKILSQYVKPEFTQNLINRQEEINQVISQYMDFGKQKKSNSVSVTDQPANNQNYFFKKMNSKFIKLYTIRQKVFRSLLTKINSDYELFEKVMGSANEVVHTWNGKLIFVYLPGPERFYKNQIDPAKEQVLAIIRNKGIEIIDIEEEFLKTPLPKNFFENSHSHYNEKGYQFVSSLLLKKIKETK